MKAICRYLIYLLIVIALLLPVLWPLFHPGFFNLHDYTHVARLYEMNKAIKDGHFPVYWVKDLGWGYGIPLFNFYAPLPYYLAEIFYLAGFSFLTSIKICFGLTVLIGLIGMFQFAQSLWGKWGGLVSAVALIYSPYRALDFFVRGALGEIFAISLIPWVLWAITDFINKQIIKSVNRRTNNQIRQPANNSICKLAILLALFLLSHTILDFVGLPIFIIYTIIYSVIFKLEGKQVIKIFFGTVLGFGLASFFVLPAFFENNLVQVDKLTFGYSHYSHHFLYFRQFLQGRWGYGGSVDGINDGMSFHLGKAHLLLAGLAILLSWIAKNNKKYFQRFVLIFSMSGFILVLAYLSTYHAKPIWDAIPLMAFIQFPWRLNSFIIVFLAAVAGGAIYYVKTINRKLALGVLLSGLFLLIEINGHYFRPQYFVNADDYYYTDEIRIKKNMSGIIPDYLPLWVKNEPQEIAFQPYKIITGNPQVSLIKDKTHFLELNIKSDNVSEIQINKFYFPGWQVYINKQKVDFSYQNSNGIINVKVPSGNNNLAVKLKKTSLKTISIIISLVSLLILGGLIVKVKKIK